MRSQLRTVHDGDLVYEALAFVCPGCRLMHERSTGLHLLPVNSPHKTPQWSWDGSLEAPTLGPSILTRHGGDPSGVCHSFLVAGVFQFLDDCTHPLAGQRAPLPELEDWMVW